MTVSGACDRLGLERNEGHVARLALCVNQKERVHYLCEVLESSGSLASREVLDMLELYGYLPRRDRQKANVRNLVSQWRKARGLDDTGGPIPQMTPEMLAILDERVGVADPAVVTSHPVRSLTVVPSVISDDTQVVGASESERTREVEAAGSVGSEVEAAGSVGSEVEAAGSVGSEVEAARVPGRRRRGTWAASVVAAAATGLSAEGNLRWFSEDVGVSAPFVYGVFAVMELALLACAWMMFEHVRDYGCPGPMRVVAWAICGVSAFAAVEVFGPYDGLLRAVVGPVGALVFLHAALGIEIRAGKGRVTVWSRLVEEYRERFLSVVGLGNEHRTALQRTRERAARRAARLTLASGWTTPFRGARLSRALDKSGVDIDPEMWRRTRSALAVRQHRDALKTLDLPSPWITS